jgi:dipeptidyl aminopeptidase/acylaminoacyl peptidase
VQVPPAGGRPAPRGTALPSISPDGECLYYIRGDTIGDNQYVLTEPDMEEALTAAIDPGSPVARISPDGRRLVFGHAPPTGHRLGIRDVATRQASYADGVDLSWNRSGLLHVWLWPSGETAPGLWRVDVAGGAARRRITLTTACNTGHMDIAVDAERGVCRGEDIRSDIGLMDLGRAIR